MSNLKDAGRRVNAVFGLRSAQHLFKKLVWEHEHFRHAMAADNYRYPDPSPIYWAFNCAVTAWHLVDWIWADATDEQKAKLASTYGFNQADGRDAFAKALLDLVPELAACSDIANGSKHFKLTRPKTSVEAETNFAVVVDPAMTGLSRGDYLLAMHVWLPGRNMTAGYFFDTLLAFWHDLMRSIGMFENAQCVIDMLPPPPKLRF
jgi:hypothetical protein